MKEIERNNRVKQVMSNRTQTKKLQTEKLTQDEMFEVKAFMKDGFTRNESVELVLSKRKLLNTKEYKKDIIKDWNNGGYINDNKYKQPIKHKLY